MWRDLTDPRVVASGVDLEADLKEPIFENLEIPEQFGPIQLTIDEHKVRRFAFTQADYNPWSLDKGPEGVPIGQAGLLANDVLQLFTTKYKASRTVGLHTESQIWLLSPARVGETVTVQGVYTDAYRRQGQGYVVMQASVTGEDGRTIFSHRGVEILRTQPGDLVGRGSAAITGRKVTGEIDPSSGSAETALAELDAGAQIAPLQKVITHEQASVFSRSGEFVRNVHNDLDVARAGGFRIPIVQGQQQFCLVTELLTRFFGYGFLGGGWVRCKFINALEVFEAVEVSGKVIGLREEEGAMVMDVDVWLRRPDGKLTTVGWASSPIGREAQS